MSIKTEHIRQFIIKPTLLWMATNLHEEMASPQAVSQIIATVCHESCSGYFLNQVTGVDGTMETYGPAAGICMIEKPTLEHVMKYASNKYSAQKKNQSWLKLIKEQFGQISMDALRYNPGLSIVICRLKYWTIKSALPKEGNLIDIANYWGKYYQTGSQTTSLDKKELLLIKHCMQYYPDYFIKLSKLNERFINMS